VGREPGEVRILLLEAMGLGAADGGGGAAAGAGDDDDEDGEGTVTGGARQARGSGMLSRIGLRRGGARDEADAFRRSVVRALVRKGVRVDHARVRSLVATVEDATPAPSSAALLTAMHLAPHAASAEEPMPYWEQGRPPGVNAAAPSAAPLLDTASLASFKRYGAPPSTAKPAEATKDLTAPASPPSSLQMPPPPPPPTAKTPMAFAVFRCGSFEAQTNSHPVRATSASGALAAPTAPVTPERAARQRSGLSIAPWRELVAVRWDGVSSVTLTLWCLPREAPAPAVSATRGAAGAGAGATPAGAAAPVCIGTASFTLHGLSPGLPERITVPLLTRVRVRVPVLPAPAPPAARPMAAATAAIAEVAEDGEEDGDGDGGPAGEAGEEEEEDDDDDEEDGEGGAAMRTGFAPTGAQLSVSLVAKAPLFVDECVEIAAGTLTFEAFYWPRK
jgi:hypothetical protein